MIAEPTTKQGKGHAKDNPVRQYTLESQGGVKTSCKLFSLLPMPVGTVITLTDDDRVWTVKKRYARYRLVDGKDVPTRQVKACSDERLFGEPLFPRKK